LRQRAASQIIAELLQNRLGAYSFRLSEAKNRRREGTTMAELLDETMTDMTWVEVQRRADSGSIALIPIGVIEEHGPQLPLGTDFYTATIHCRAVGDKLKQRGIASITAPPFYWGICQSTGGCIGSFRIRKETAKNLLVDIIVSLREFGFKQIFGINAHGDIEQNVMALEAFREATETTDVEARYVFSKSVMRHYGLAGDEAYLCPIEPQTIQVSLSEAPDVHAGDVETATMLAFKPESVDAALAKRLKPVRVGDDQIMTWLMGGHTRELSAGGYLGSPADFESVRVMENLDDIASRIATAILAFAR
jgi:creatinine amidohydrolase